PVPEVEERRAGAAGRARGQGEGKGAGQGKGRREGQEGRPQLISRINFQHEEKLRLFSRANPGPDDLHLRLLLERASHLQVPRRRTSPKFRPSINARRKSSSSSNSTSPRRMPMPRA